MFLKNSYPFFYIFNNDRKTIRTQYGDAVH